MKKKNFTLTTAILFGSLLLTTGCSTGNTQADSASSTSEQSTTKASTGSKGKELTNTLGGTNWQGTTVYDQDKTDLTAENGNFIGLAKYDADTGRYEFFNAETGATRDDRGTFFITNDGSKRILISETMNYQAVVEITELTDQKFTYKRTGKDKDGNDTEVFVEHEPYKDKELAFTESDKDLTASTGTIETGRSGDEILGETLWNGTKVVDEEGNDVTEQNNNFISLAKFEADTSKYGFFNLENGESRGDYGYFAVIHDNKIRAHVSLGNNKYGVALEITELNDKKFTYKRNGKDKDGKEITVFVEHEPYSGDLKPELPSF